MLAIVEAGDAAAAPMPEAPAEAPAKVEVSAPDVAPKTIKTSPAVRRLLDEHDLDATMVMGTGKDGRITKSDVMSFLKTDDSHGVTPGDAAPVATEEGSEVGLERVEQRVPMSRLRARIAERLLEAQHTARC